MGDLEKQSNFIGQYFRQYIKQTGFDRVLLAKKLKFNYSNNARMICAYLTKRDYLWEQYEVEKWCKALLIKKDSAIYTKLIEKAGRKKYDYDK